MGGDFLFLQVQVNSNPDIRSFPGFLNFYPFNLMTGAKHLAARCDQTRFDLTPEMPVRLHREFSSLKGEESQSLTRRYFSVKSNAKEAEAIRKSKIKAK